MPVWVFWPDLCRANSAPVNLRWASLFGGMQPTPLLELVNHIRPPVVAVPGKSVLDVLQVRFEILDLIVLGDQELPEEEGYRPGEDTHNPPNRGQRGAVENELRFFHITVWVAASASAPASAWGLLSGAARGPGREWPSAAARAWQ